MKRIALLLTSLFLVSELMIFEALGNQNCEPTTELNFEQHPAECEGRVGDRGLSSLKIRYNCQPINQIRCVKLKNYCKPKVKHKCSMKRRTIVRAVCKKPVTRKLRQPQGRIIFCPRSSQGKKQIAFCYPKRTRQCEVPTSWIAIPEEMVPPLPWTLIPSDNIPPLYVIMPAGTMPSKIIKPQRQLPSEKVSRRPLPKCPIRPVPMPGLRFIYLSCFISVVAALGALLVLVKILLLVKEGTNRSP